MSDINPEKLEKMWKKILKYESEDGMMDKDTEAIKNIMKIIDEVYDECY